MLDGYKLVIFDWDSTVMDSIARIVSSLAEAARLTGGLPELSADELKQMIGLSLDKGYEFLYPDSPLSLRECWKANYAQQFKTDNRTPHGLYPSTRDVLERLKAEGYLLAVATGKTRVGLDRALAETNTEGLFDATRTADETASKPEPLMIQELLEELSVSADKALMVGDTSHDMALANNAGVDAVGITWGVHDDTVLSSYKPRQILPDLTSLLVR